MKSSQQQVIAREPLRAPEGSAAPAASTTLMVYVVQAAFGFLLAGLGPCLILLARDLATPREALSWVSAGFGAGLLLMGVAGELVLRMGARRLLQVSAAAQGLGAALLAIASTLEPARAGAILLGLGGAGMVLAVPVLLSGAEGTAQLSRANGLSSLSGIASPLFISLVDAIAGSGRMALLLAVPSLVWTATRFFKTGPRPPIPQTTPPSPSAASGAGWRAIWWWTGIVAAVSPEFAFVVWGAARLQDSGLGEAAAAAAAAAFPVGMSLGRLVLVPRLLGRVPLVQWGVALAIAGCLACAAPLGPIPITVVSGLAGLGIAPLYPLTLDRLVRTPGLDPRRGATVGALGSGVAVLFAPILLSALGRVISLRLGFLAAAPLLLLVLGLHARGNRSAEARG